MTKRRAKKFLSRESATQGSAGGALILSLGALGLAGIFVFNSGTEIRNQVKAERVRAAQEAASNGAISNFAVFKSLLGPMRTDLGPPDAREPFLYATDYFAENWTLNQNKTHFRVTDIAVPAADGSIKLRTARSSFLAANDAASIFAGENHQTNSAKARNFTHSVMKIVRSNPSATNPFYRESVVVSTTDFIDVMEQGKTVVKETTPSFALIHLTPPRPSVVRLYAVRIGDETNRIDLSNSGLGSASSPLAAGTYKFQLATAGVALSGVIQINGVSLQVGVVGQHKFNNINAPLGIIGETPPIRLGNIRKTTTSSTITRGGTTVGQTVTRAADGCGFDVNENQSVTFGGGVGGPAAITTLDEGANQIKISAWINRVDLTNTMDEFPIDLTIYASDGAESFVDAPVVKDAPPKNITPMCADKCVAISENMIRSGNPADHTAYYAWMDDSLKNPDPGYNDVLASEATANKQQQLNQPGFNLKGRICLSRDRMSQKIFDTFGMLPSQAEKLRTDQYYARQANGKTWYHNVAEPLERYVYYAEPTCERVSVGARGDKCGCFAADTQIEMADGQFKLASEIRPGDFVWNPKTRKAQSVKEVIVGPEKIAMIEVKTIDRSLTVTTGHPFLTKKGLIEAKKLKAGDRIINGHSETIVTSVSHVSQYGGDAEPEVWNFVLEGSENHEDHYINANGVMTGDLFLQRQLSESN